MLKGMGVATFRFTPDANFAGETRIVAADLDFTSVPEPGTWILWIVGLAGALGLRTVTERKPHFYESAGERSTVVE